MEHAGKSSSLNYSRTLELSCFSFRSSGPLFSTACALFDKNRRVGTSATAQRSRPSHLLVIFFALCFHILTNCFSRKRFVFTTIRIARGCGGGHSAIYWLRVGCLPDQIVRMNKNLSDGREMARVFSDDAQKNESRAIRRWSDCARAVQAPDCIDARFAARSVISLSAARGGLFPS
jgi:hypothetical protein